MSAEPWNDNELERRQKMRRVAMALIEQGEQAALDLAHKLCGASLWERATNYAEGFKAGLELSAHRINDCGQDCIYCYMENGQ